MPRFEIDVDPCDHITADAIGKPGQRVFYLQAYQDTRTITIIIEKAQLLSLAVGVEQFLGQLSQQNPDLEEASGDFMEDAMRIHPPVDPLFRAGEIGLGYDKERDRVVVFTKELLTEDADPDSAAQIRFWATRTQIRRLASLVGDKIFHNAEDPSALNVVSRWSLKVISVQRKMGTCIKNKVKGHKSKV